jgi:DNA-binding transcriptional LysR family regulator
MPSYALPSLNVLRIFVLAARTGSFKDAAGLLRVKLSSPV